MDAKKIVLDGADDWVGRTFRIDDEKVSRDKKLSPLVGELVNGVVFLRSLNRSCELIRVGYMLLGERLERHEANGRWGGHKNKEEIVWTNYEPGCHPTSLVIGDLRLCQVEVATCDTTEDASVWSSGRSPYKPEQKPKAPKQPQAAPKAQPPKPTELDDGWVLI